MRALLFVSLLTACSSKSSLQSCDVDALVASDVALANYVPCGTFTKGDVNYTDEAMASAQACVLNAISANRPYALVYDAAEDTGNGTSTITGELRIAWTGIMPTGAKTVTSHVYAGQGHDGDMSMSNVSATTCSTVSPAAGCTPSVGVPCLTCAQLGAGNVVCRH